MAELGEKKENALRREGSVVYLWVMQDIKNELVKLAQKRGMTLSAVLREAIADYLSK